MNSVAKIVLIVILFIALIFLRGVYSNLLYDPFINYFKFNYLYEGFPELNKFQYFTTISVRYFLNSTISLVIIYGFFNKKEVIAIATKIYLVIFIVLNAIFFMELVFNFSNSYLVLFYVRRFLIHPLLLLVLLPAFYYQFLTKKK